MLAVFTLICVVLVIAVGLASFQLSRMQKQLAPMIQRELSTMLGRDVRVGSVHVRGLNQVVIADAAVAKGKTFADGTALTAPETVAHVNLVNLALHRMAHPIDYVSEVDINHPRAAVNRSQQGRWDFQDVIDHIKAAAPSSAGWHTRLVVNNGDISYDDAHGFGGQTVPIHQEIVEVQGNVTPQPDANYAFEVSATDAARHMGQVRLKGNYAAKKGDTQIDVDANRVAVNALTRYLPKNLPITFTDGTAAFRLSALFRALPHADARHPLPATEVTAEVDMTGVGLRLQEMSTPIVATSGRLRLVNDRTHYPNGSRVDLINVQARAASVPVSVNGSISEINLLDLAHTHPRFDLALHTSVPDGAMLTSLFPQTHWLQKVKIGGTVGIDATVQGHRGGDLQIEGTAKSDSVAFEDFHATGGVHATYHLLPNADGKQSVPTIQASVKAHQAQIGTTTIADLALNTVSSGAWKQLATDPHFSGVATASAVHATWGNSAQVRGEYTADRYSVNFQSINGQIFGGQVSATAYVPFQLPGAPAYTLSADGKYTGVDLAQVARQFHYDQLSGSGQGTIALHIYPDGKIALDTDLNGTGVQYQKYLASTLNATLNMVDTNGTVHVDIPHAVAQTEYGILTTEKGTYDYVADAAQGTFKLPLRGEAMPLQRFGYEPLIGQATATGTLEGSTTAPVLHAAVSAKDGSILGRTFTEAHSDVSYQAGKLLLKNVELVRPNMTLLIPGGDGFDPRQGLDGVNANLQLHGAALDDVLALLQKTNPYKIDGGIEGSMDIHKEKDTLVVAGLASIDKPLVHIPRGNVGDYRLPLDRLKLAFNITGHQMQVQDLQIDRHGTTVHVQGTAESNDGSAALANLNFHSTGASLADLPQDLFGIPVRLTGPGEVSGTLNGVLDGSGPTPLTLNLTASSPQLQVEGVPVGTGEVELAYKYRPQQRDLTILHGTVNNAAFHATSTGHYQLDNGTMDGVQFALDHIDLSALHGLVAQVPAGPYQTAISKLAARVPAQLAGTGQAQLTASGPMGQPDMQLGFNMAQLAAGATPLPNMHGTLSAKAQGGHYGLHIDEMVAEGNVPGEHAQVSGDVSATGDLQLQFAGQGISAKTLAPWVKQLPIDGNAQINGTVVGPWKAPVLEADLALDNPVIGGHTLQQLRGHLREDAQQLTLSEGTLSATSGAQPISLHGTFPLGWSRLSQPMAQNGDPLSLVVQLPPQDIAPLRAFLPDLPNINGTVEGNLQVAGTLAQPKVVDGHMAVAGNADLGANIKGVPSQLRNIDLFATLSDNGNGQSTVTLNRFNAQIAGRQSAGSFTSAGTIAIPNGALASPMQWHWDVYGRLMHLPLAPEVFMVSQASGLFHLNSDQAGPVITGVVYVDNAKIKEPDGPMNTPAGWGALAFNPRLSMVLQVGSGLKVSKGMFSVPLQSTPLPPVVLSDMTAPDTTPRLDTRQQAAGYDWNADMLNPGTSAEAPGTWGAVTGTLSDPHLYARFEVNKGKLSFPLNLFGSVRNARGHITYTLGEGAQVTMGTDNMPAPAGRMPVNSFR